MMHDFARPEALVFLSEFAMLRNLRKSVRENPRQPRLVDKTFLLLMSGGRKRSLISSKKFYSYTNNNAPTESLINSLFIESEPSEIIKFLHKNR